MYFRDIPFRQQLLNKRIKKKGPFFLLLIRYPPPPPSNAFFKATLSIEWGPIK